MSLKQYRPISMTGRKIVVKTSACDRIKRMTFSRKTDDITWITPFDEHNHRLGGFCVKTSQLEAGVPIQLVYKTPTPLINHGQPRSTNTMPNEQLVNINGLWFSPSCIRRMRERLERERVERERLERERIERERVELERDQRFYHEARVHRAIIAQERFEEESFQRRRRAYFAQKARHEEREREALARRVLTGSNAIPVRYRAT